MPENCYMGVFGVKEFIFDVKNKTASWWKLELKFWREPNFRGKFQGVGALLQQKIYFICIYIAHSFRKYHIFLFTIYWHLNWKRFLFGLLILINLQY